jgi:[acyl-carrier-protein] S-malonyltransferase
MAAGGGKIAVLFPGQGSQTSGMRELAERWRPDLVSLARAEVTDEVFERTEESTAFAQPAIYCAALSGWEALRGGLDPDFMAGHSLGEISALAAAGCIAADDGLRLVALRGRLMAEAGGGGMLAVRLRDRETLERVARCHDLVVANDNAPGQQVLAGTVEALEAAAEELREHGAAVQRLPVAGAFHSPLMASAVAPFRAALAEVELAETRIPVLSGVTAEPFDDVRERLAEAVVSPVRWLDSMRALAARGVDRFVETGPGRILTGLVRRSLDGVEAEAPLLSDSPRV